MLLTAPLLTFLGLGVATLSSAMESKQRVQRALEAAALAATKELAARASISDAELEQIWSTYFQAGLEPIGASVTCEDPKGTSDRLNIVIALTVNCNQNSPIETLLPSSVLEFSNETVADFDLTKLDVAFMLDVSGSMRGSKMRALKESMNDAFDILLDMNRTDEVKIGIAPYSTTVNIGDYADTLKGADAHDSCVAERRGPAAFKDDAPVEGEFDHQPHSGCPNVEILPLTKDSGELRSYVNGLQASGWTAGHIGTAWAWYLISENWASLWPAESRPRPADDPHQLKAVVLMTDGQYNIRYINHGSSEQQARRMCQAMKDDGVIVFSVAFRAPTRSRRLLADCATGEETTFVADNPDALRAAYQAIARSFVRLIITG